MFFSGGKFFMVFMDWVLIYFGRVFYHTNFGENTCISITIAQGRPTNCDRVPVCSPLLRGFNKFLVIVEIKPIKKRNVYINFKIVTSKR